MKLPKIVEDYLRFRSYVERTYRLSEVTSQTLDSFEKLISSNEFRDFKRKFKKLYNEILTLLVETGAIKLELKKER